MNKQQLLQTLKDAPYSDSLISQWMETFQDDHNVNEYLTGIRHNNKEWARVKSMMSIDRFVQELYQTYVNQGLPHGLIVPLMICSCPSIRDMFLAWEFSKNVKVEQRDGMTFVDMSN